MNSVISENASVADTLDLVYRLCGEHIQNNLASWLSAALFRLNSRLVKAEFNHLDGGGAYFPEPISAFGIPEELLSAPIAQDWQGFNQYDNRGKFSPVSLNINSKNYYLLKVSFVFVLTVRF